MPAAPELKRHGDRGAASVATFIAPYAVPLRRIAEFFSRFCCLYRKAEPLSDLPRDQVPHAAHALRGRFDRKQVQLCRLVVWWARVTETVTRVSWPPGARAFWGGRSLFRPDPPLGGNPLSAALLWQMHGAKEARWASAGRPGHVRLPPAGRPLRARASTAGASPAAAERALLAPRPFGPRGLAACKPTRAAAC
jgi:hypothetical protein